MSSVSQPQPSAGSVATCVSTSRLVGVLRAATEQAWVLAHALRLLDGPADPRHAIEDDHIRFAPRPDQTRRTA